MSERLTDKKRGFIGEPGNLISNVNGLSLNRFMREDLGGLSQSQLKRFTPEGNVTIQSFGMYEKVISEPIVKKEEITTISERVVALVYYRDSINYSVPARKRLLLIEIKPASYKIVSDIAVGEIFGTDPYSGGVLTASWNYERGKFLVFFDAQNDSSYYLYEVSLTGEKTLVAEYVLGNDWGAYPSHKFPEFYHSYGPSGDLNLMWLGFPDPLSEYKGYYYLLILNKHYGFGSYTYGSYTDLPTGERLGNPSTVMIINKADCTSYHHPTYNAPILSWVTHDNVRIIKPVTDADENYYGEAYQRVCEVKKRIAFLHDSDIFSGNFPFHVDLCGEYEPAGLMGISGQKETPTSFLDSHNTIKESRIFNRTINPPSGFTLQWLGYAFQFVGYYATGLGTPYFVYVDGLRYWQIPVHMIGNPDVIHGFYCPPYMEVNSYELVTWGALGWQVDVETEVIYTDPDGIPHSLMVQPGHYCFGVIVWTTLSTYENTEREDYYDMRYVNKHYVVVGEKEDAYKRIFVLDDQGNEKYEIELEDFASTVSLERVIVE